MSTKRKLEVVAKPALKQSAKPLDKQRLNDSKAVVISGGSGADAKVNGQHTVVEISSGEEEEDSEEDEASSDEEEIAQDASMGDAANEEEADDLAHPSFGDLVRINAAETIDVANAFSDPSSTALKKSGNNSTSDNQNNIESRLGASLGTVLTQALKTNDQSLLEQCLQETDLQTVRLTLQRLASPLASNLLHNLASRLHRKPGRAGSLIVWIQWALVTHGGYLATQPGLNKELAELHRVVDERSRGLQPLLHLKGKLDMLEAQLKLRKSMQHRNLNEDDGDDEEAVIYVEGEDSDEEEASDRVKGKGRAITNGDISDATSEVSEDMPNTNGIIADEEEDSDEEDSEGEGLIEDQAEETDADSADEDEVDFDDQDEAEEDSDDEKDAPPPSKLQKITSTFSRRK